MAACSKQYTYSGQGRLLCWRCSPTSAAVLCTRASMEWSFSTYPSIPSLTRLPRSCSPRVVLALLFGDAESVFELLLYSSSLRTFRRWLLLRFTYMYRSMSRLVGTARSSNNTYNSIPGTQYPSPRYTHVPAACTWWCLVSTLSPHISAWYARTLWLAPCCWGEYVLFIFFFFVR